MFPFVILHLKQDDPLWSARLLHTEPQVIRDVHESYLKHGADVIITSSYQVCPGYVVKYTIMLHYVNLVLLLNA